jgi:hypothetical protein
MVETSISINLSPQSHQNQLNEEGRGNLKMAIKHTRDATANDSDKIVLTAPNTNGNRKMIEILQVHIVNVTTATAGNRQIVMHIQDDTDTIVADYHAGSTQAASLTRHYVFGQGVYRETSFVDGSIQCPFPAEGTVLLPGWDLRVYDSGAIAAAADDMTVDVIYREVDLGDVQGI